LLRQPQAGGRKSVGLLKKAGHSACLSVFSCPFDHYDKNSVRVPSVNSCRYADRR
jgi:hypothetical protein